MLQIRNINFSIGERDLLKNVSWQLHPGRRTALIGPNGAGKTTLLKILNGENDLFSGEIIKPKDYRIGYLPQEEISIGRGTILKIAIEGAGNIKELENKIAELHKTLDSSQDRHDEILNQLAKLEQRFEAMDGYRLESKTKSILSGLGFSEKDFDRSLQEFSGGWRMRVYLAKLLIQDPDLLLLDEPTNHLDLPSLEWLEQYLFDFRGSIVIVSHDRFFIDRLAHEIYELDRGDLVHYAGNYHFFELEKAKREELILKKFEALQDERERQEKFINRFRYKATKASQVQSRIKQLEKLEKVELPPPPRKFSFDLSVEIQSYKDVLKIDNMSFKYDSQWVLEDLNLSLFRGEKICLVGVNGAGKTTLTRLIARELTPQKGSVQLGQRVQIGYYAQHQVDTLNLESTVFDEVASTVANSLFPKIRDVLGLFQFSGNDVNKKIKVLSGGEKARVSLAKILLSPVNFLIMDEPTNHLDLVSREALEKALSKYDGTLLLISHDRYFLDKLVTRVVEIKDHRMKEFEGDYSEYLARRTQEMKVAEKNIEKKDNSGSGKKTKEQKRIEAVARQSISKERSQLKKVIDNYEKEIENLESRKIEIETALALPNTYQNGELAASLQKEYSEVKENLAVFYERWEEAQLKLEEMVSNIL